MALILAVAALVGAVDYAIDRLFGLSSSSESMAIVALLFVVFAALRYFTKGDPRVFTGGALFCAIYSGAILLGVTDDLTHRMTFVLIFLALSFMAWIIGRVAKKMQKEKG
jgi:hypothetical protein